MAKQGLTLNQIKGTILKDRSQKSGWALCIGAGTSTPAFPLWPQLVEKLVALDVDKSEAPLLSKKLLDIYSPDTLIQATQNRIGLSDDEFVLNLRDQLYSELETNLTKQEYSLLTKCLIAPAGNYKKAVWSKYLKLIRSKFPNLSALQLAEVICDIQNTSIEPSAILSFNAEPLLASIVNALYRDRFPNATNPNKSTLKGEQRKILDLVTHSISNRQKNRIPYFFCHGLLPVPTLSQKKRPLESLDKLVFSEADYLQLSNTNYSWQSTVFIDVCTSRSVVFVGVSLSDANLRRWLSWIHSNRMSELSERQQFKGDSTTHFWINKKPKNSDERRWIESSVSILGVRLIWIDEWTQVGDALKVMLGV